MRDAERARDELLFRALQVEGRKEDTGTGGAGRFVIRDSEVRANRCRTQRAAGEAKA